MSRTDSWITPAWLFEALAHLRAAAESDGPHVVESPPSCDGCGQWGAGIVAGECSVCEGER